MLPTETRYPDEGYYVGRKSMLPTETRYPDEGYYVGKKRWLKYFTFGIETRLKNISNVFFVKEIILKLTSFAENTNNNRYKI